MLQLFQKLKERVQNIRFNRKELIFTLVFMAMIALLFVTDTGFEKQIYMNSEGVRARVISVNNDGAYNTGLIRQGAQSCVIEILSGTHKGETAPATNFYSGKLEFDKAFVPGDIAWVLLERDTANSIVFANMVEHYRIGKELTLIGLFALGIILLSGFTGIRTLLSFAFALLSIWKILVPGMLRGYDPVLLALLIGNLITIATLLLVAGFTKKAYAAILGSVACSLFTCLIAILLGGWFNIHGAVMQWAESLLYAGFENLDLTAIFQAGIYLACSGAILDLAIDISSALDEVALANPAITPKALLRSGLTIGRSVVGSQTTTLLLAYMGSYISVMMVYMAQGTPMMSIFNSKMVAAEILHTFVGCLGLILVCPCTAAICVAMYKRAPKQAQACAGEHPLQPLTGNLPVE